MAIALVLYFFFLWLGGCKICNVLDYGGRGDGISNDTNAIIKAIEDCGLYSNISSPPVLLFPANHSYKTWPFGINGSNITLKGWSNLNEGNKYIIFESNTLLFNGVNATGLWPSLSIPNFLSFSNVINLSINGSSNNQSIINGMGEPWWILRKNSPFSFAPMLVALHNCKNVNISGITLINSPYWTLSYNNSQYINIFNMIFSAPKDSPNTASILLGNSSNSIISNNWMSMGDDIVAIQKFCHDILIENNYAEHGHGMSIGSIGENGEYGYVYNILFRNNILSTTSYVARIKTWESGSGYIRNVTYKNMTFYDVPMPIYITQYYCPHSQHPGNCTNSTVNVNISDITFEQFFGTQSGGFAGQFECSDSLPCSKITLRDVNISSTDNGGNKWSCWQVEQSTKTNVVPPITSDGNCKFIDVL
eukprot:338939_1